MELIDILKKVSIGEASIEEKNIINNLDDLTFNNLSRSLDSDYSVIDIPTEYDEVNFTEKKPLNLKVKNKKALFYVTKRSKAIKAIKDHRKASTLS